MHDYDRYPHIMDISGEKCLGNCENCLTDKQITEAISRRDKLEKDFIKKVLSLLG